MSDLRTWHDGWRCGECCNGDRCDDPSHYSRQHCPHCKGTGSAIWSMYTKEREAKDAAARIVALEAESASALAYATTLAKSMHRQHYADVAPNWQPLPDVVGVLTQIDNMYAGVRDDLATAEHENARLVGANLASLKAEVERLRAAYIQIRTHMEFDEESGYACIPIREWPVIEIDAALAAKEKS